MDEKKMMSIMEDLTDKYAKKLGLKTPAVSFLSFPSNASVIRADYVDNVLEFSVYGFLRTYYVDKDLSMKLLKWGIVHDLAHIRQYERGLYTTHCYEADKSVFESDADFVAERITGIRPRDAHEMFMRVKKHLKFSAKDYPKRIKDWKGVKY